MIPLHVSSSSSKSKYLSSKVQFWTTLLKPSLSVQVTLPKITTERETTKYGTFFHKSKFRQCSLLFVHYNVKGNITQWLPVLKDIQRNTTPDKMTEIVKAKVVKVVTVTFNTVSKHGRDKEYVWLQETCTLHVATLTNGTGQYTLLSG